MRIAVISDPHGNLPALEAVLADVARQGVERTVCLGDLAFKGPFPDECVSLIRERGIPCVYGNTDIFLLTAAGRADGAAAPGWTLTEDERPYLDWHVARLSSANLEYLASLELQFRLDVAGEPLLFVHATPQDCQSAIRPDDPPERLRARVAGAACRWLVMGHIHEPFLRRFDGKWLINTGAIGFSLDRDWRAAYAIIDPSSGRVEFRRVEYDLESVVRAAEQRAFCFNPAWYGEALRQGWWEPIPYARRRALDAR
ncbi:MAG TPA: metallophosphoesterase family protein [Limnochordia bacterium]|nr:metallophosphoesterase family protein [Limnochordia bacterium]